jgi:2C-methyl-D-erythritol 2,4-cyclodiphosphate synthase
MASQNQNLKDETLAQLEALRGMLTSDTWQIQMMSADPDQKQQNSDVEILVDARIAQLEDAQLGQIQAQIDANAPQLSDAIAGMKDALGSIQEIGKVLTAATTLLKVVGRVVALMAR